MRMVGIYGRGVVVVVMEWWKRSRENRRKATVWELRSTSIASEASLADWLAGQCGVVDFAWMTGNQGYKIS